MSLLTSKSLIEATAVGLMAGGLTYAFLSMLSIPDVHVSYSTNECVEVLNYKEGDRYSCENLPSRYNHVWVK